MDILSQLNSPVLYLICGGIIFFVALVCVFFMVRAYRAGAAIGMHEVAHVIERHDDHHDPAHEVHRVEPRPHVQALAEQVRPRLGEAFDRRRHLRHALPLLP